MARKTVLVSDMSGQEIPDGKGATIRITFQDARKGVRELDVTDAEAERLGGRQVAGRSPRARRADLGDDGGGSGARPRFVRSFRLPRGREREAVGGPD